MFHLADPMKTWVAAQTKDVALQQRQVTYVRDLTAGPGPPFTGTIARAAALRPMRAIASGPSRGHLDVEPFIARKRRIKNVRNRKRLH